jgi:predicted metal-dependent TIM-barrel fold hydrolase
MKLFDPHIHMTSRTTLDYEAMAGAGIAAVVEPSFWMGQPRTHVGTFEDYFAALLGWERFRASQFGIRHFCTLSLNPKEANTARIAQGVIDLLPRYLSKDGVVAVGEIGYDDMTSEEDKYFAAQLELAIRFDLPVLIHTPHRSSGRWDSQRSGRSSTTTPRRRCRWCSRARAGRATPFIPSRRWMSRAWSPS